MKADFTETLDQEAAASAYGSVRPDIADDALKANVIRIAQHHRQTCPGESCQVSLFQLVMLLDRAGIRLNNQELREFL